jgi:two-component system response regulator
MNEKIILLVEDNPDDVALTRRVMEKHNVYNRIVEAHDGVEALDYLFGTGAHAGRDLRQQPHLVLLDLKLPKVDGLEVLRRIRGDPRTRLQPVVILTSSKEESDIVTSYALGANSYVRKPVDFAEFSDAIRQLGLYWLLFNETPPPMGK